MQSTNKETEIARLETALDLAWKDATFCLRTARVGSKVAGKAVAMAKQIEAQILEIEPNYFEIKLAQLRAEDN